MWDSIIEINFFYKNLQIIIRHKSAKIEIRSKLSLTQTELDGLVSLVVWQ